VADLKYKGIGLKTGTITFEMKLDTEAFDRLMKHFPQGCQEFCRRTKDCKVQCVGDDPHKPDFGPFHVFVQHDHTSK
jgi:hypothetical protein